MECQLAVVGDRFEIVLLSVLFHVEGFRVVGQTSRSFFPSDSLHPKQIIPSTTITSNATSECVTPSLTNSREESQFYQ